MPRRQRFKPTRKNKPAVIEDETIVPPPKPPAGSEPKPFDFESNRPDHGLEVHPDDGD